MYTHYIVYEHYLYVSKTALWCPEEMVSNTSKKKFMLPFNISSKKSSVSA